jgi:hypothetical protein
MKIEQLLESAPSGFLAHLKAIVSKTEQPVLVKMVRTRSGAVYSFQQAAERKVKGDEILSADDMRPMFIRLLRKFLADELSRGTKLVMMDSIKDKNAARIATQRDATWQLENIDAYLKNKNAAEWGVYPSIFVLRKEDELVGMTIDMTLMYENDEHATFTGFSFHDAPEVINAIVKVSNSYLGKVIVAGADSKADIDKLLAILKKHGAPVDQLTGDIKSPFDHAKLRVTPYKALQRAREIPGTEIGALILKLAEKYKR